MAYLGAAQRCPDGAEAANQWQCRLAPKNVALLRLCAVRVANAAKLIRPVICISEMTAR